jgi:tetratricopeptide (TPR) repeat protein
VARSLAAAAPQDLRFRRQLARAVYTLGTQYREIGDNAHALESFLEALPVFQAAHEIAPGDGEVSRSLTSCHKRLGAILNERGETAAALEHLSKAVELDEASLLADPGSAQKQRNLSVANVELGFGRLRSGDARSALVAYGRALALRENLVRADARNAQAPHDLASVLWYIGVAENALRHWPAAIASLERAMPLSIRPVSDRDGLRASILSGLADAHEGAGRLGQALQLRREGRQFRRALLTAKPEVHTLRRAVAADDEALGNTLAAVAARESLPSSRRSRWREAQAAYAEGLDLVAVLEVEGKTEPADKALGDRLRRALSIAADRLGTLNAN